MRDAATDKLISRTAAIIKKIHRSTSDKSDIVVDREPVIDLNSIMKLGNKTQYMDAYSHFVSS